MVNFLLAVSPPPLPVFPVHSLQLVIASSPLCLFISVKCGSFSSFLSCSFSFFLDRISSFSPLLLPFSPLPPPPVLPNQYPTSLHLPPAPPSPPGCGQYGIRNEGCCYVRRSSSGGGRTGQMERRGVVQHQRRRHAHILRALL